MTTLIAPPVSTTDPINSRILVVSEDRLAGFQADPIRAISEQSGVDIATVVERLRAMLAAGTIRRIRQTVMTANLAAGALVAWSVPNPELDRAFETMLADDPFTGHIVVRSTDAELPGSAYRLWTTLKVPHGYSLDAHCRLMASRVGATAFRVLPAHRLYKLGVGHVRRRGVEPGSRAPEPAAGHITTPVFLSDPEWRALLALQREFAADELDTVLWRQRAADAGMSLDDFLALARDFDARGLVGRFSTFLEHVKPLSTGERVTRYNALFHWAVPSGFEDCAGCEIGRHDVMTHAYWRDAGAEFGGVNVMGVMHGTDKASVLAHKAAIDAHLGEAGIPLLYTNVFWGGRSEVRPSEISPFAYRDWATGLGVDPDTLRA